MELTHYFIDLLHRDAVMELIRMGVVYAHLLACCVALGMVLVSDFTLLHKLVTGRSTEEDGNHLDTLKRIISYALVALWISGALVVGLDMLGKGTQYLLNPKLQAKILVVTLLTLNGFALHAYIMPTIKRAGCILKLPASERDLAIFSGTVSAVSWLYAAMLGVGRPLSWKYSLAEILAAYPLLIIGGFALTLLLVKWRKGAQPQPQFGYAGIIAHG
ncbi:hypothetical protein [Pseudomonas knackmussii]|uniref:hypothetical protein n=1 Tax=Pseudomonas knackmussii TaxID=65741 RepID=UPI003F49ECA4